MRIAIFSSTIDVQNGYGNITYELCARLHEHHDITLFLPSSEEAAVHALALPYTVRCILPPYIFRVVQPAALAYLKSVDLRGFDLVHSLFDFPYCVLAARAAKRARLPFIMGVQGTYGVWPLTLFPERYLLKWAFGRAKCITVPSRFTQDMIEKYAGRTYPFSIIHNGVNFARFQKSLDTSPVRARYGDAAILLTVGGLKERKGQDLVIRALPQVLRGGKKVVYLIVGEGKWGKYLRELARTEGVSDHVHFLGAKSGDELVSLFQACDIYVHTPKVADLHFEGFGIVYLEAGACAKPSVATDAGGIRDAVVDSVTGLIAPDGDIAGVAERILRLCGSADLRLQMGKAGREYAEKHDWNLIAEQVESLYSTARA